MYNFNSTYTVNLTGVSGPVANVTLQIPNDASGQYTITLTELVIISEDRNTHYLDDVTATLTVPTGPPAAYACFTPSDSTLTFYCDNLRSTRAGTTYDLNEGKYGQPDWRSERESISQVVFDETFEQARPTSTIDWFSGMTNLKTITGMEHLNTSQVIYMNRMFYWCSSLTSLDLSNFNTANVTDMSLMFYHCTALTSINVSSFNTASVTNMKYMFYYCHALTELNVGNFNTASVTDMSYMFDACHALTELNVNNFNTANVTDMSGMFTGCSSLPSIDVSNFNTANVTNMGHMFQACKKLTSLDLSIFNTANVTDMLQMFLGCYDLTTIYVGRGWITTAVTSSTGMFLDCYNLVGGMGSKYRYIQTDAAYAHIDGGTSNPGYFTEKTAFLRGDVDCDGSVTISDVTSLIDYLLSGNASGISLDAADCDKDGKITISDVTELIDYLLSGRWSINDEIITVNGVTFKMVVVEGGTFTMGATAEQGSDYYSNEKPTHQVTLSGYSIGETEVTQALWQAVMGSNPSHFTDDLNRPVEQVSWDDCQTFITKLNELTGKTFRLPTEAEWEYAARGGNKSQGYKYAGSNTLDEVAWYWDNIPSQTSGTEGYGTQPVATKAPNELGLYDMSGNVYEWCQDWYGSYSSESQTNPTGPASGSYRTHRSGYWGSDAVFCRVSYRGYINPLYAMQSRGLRLAL